MGQALTLALLPALVGFAIGRWWLLLIGALVITTSAGRLAGHGAAGPVVMVLLAPFAGAALGIALRRAVAPPRDPGTVGPVGMSRVKRPGAGADWQGRREGTVAEPRA